MCILCRWAHIGGLIKILYILIPHSLLLTNYSCKYITRTSNVDPMSGLYWSDDSSAIIWYLLRAILKRGFYCRADLCTAHTVILAVTVACYAHWDGIDKIASKIIVCICSQFYWFGNFFKWMLWFRCCLVDFHKWKRKIWYFWNDMTFYLFIVESWQWISVLLAEFGANERSFFVSLNCLPFWKILQFFESLFGLRLANHFQRFFILIVSFNKSTPLDFKSLNVWHLQAANRFYHLYFYATMNAMIR